MTKLFAIWPVPPNVRSMNCCLSIACVRAMRKFWFEVGLAAIGRPVARRARVSRLDARGKAVVRDRLLGLLMSV